MKYKDLINHVCDFRGNRTKRNINVYLNKKDFDFFKQNELNLACIGCSIDRGHLYCNENNFTIYINKESLIVEENYCRINSDIGEMYSEVLTEDERLIKKILE